MYTKDGIGDDRHFEIYDEDAAQRAKCCNSRYDCKVHWNRPPGKIDSLGGNTSGIYFGLYTHMFNDFTLNATGGTGLSNGNGDMCWYRGEESTLTLFGKTFNDCRKYEVFKSGGLFYSEKKFINYIVKNIGVVKKIELDSNKVWLLKRYNVIQ